MTKKPQESNEEKRFSSTEETSRWKGLKKEQKERLEKISEHWEEHRIRAYFVRLFGRYDIRNKEHFVAFGKRFIFLILVLVELLLIVQQLDVLLAGGDWRIFVMIISVAVAFTISEAMKLFVAKKDVGKRVFYMIDIIASCGFLFFTDGMYASILYMLVLTELYIDAKESKSAFALFGCALIVYLAGYAGKIFVAHPDTHHLTELLSFVLGNVFLLSLHFVVVNVALAFYRQFLKLDKALKELDESQRELEKAYESMEELSVLEERQRIAKEIHDTAGHSITTVIMQTEAAKLALDHNPEEVKSRLIAANLQAKHALEELRDSVHLLSGRMGGMTLKNALEEVIRDSTDGTGLIIRSAIEDVVVSGEKQRFLCNTLKEGIANGIRHGGATAFWFELKSEGEELFFLLSDNGVGTGGKPLKEGYGLTSMKERAIALGGSLTYEWEMEEGFELRLSLPMDSVEEGEKA